MEGKQSEMCHRGTVRRRVQVVAYVTFENAETGLELEGQVMA